MLVARGYFPSRILACVYYNPETLVKLVAHVDDFLVVGPKEACQDLLARLQEQYEVGGDALGILEDEVEEFKFLGRKIRVTKDGLEWEADEKLARSIVGEAQLTAEGKGVSTPGGAEAAAEGRGGRRDSS